MRTSLLRIISTGLILLFTLPTPAYADEEPGEIVKDTVNNVLKVLNNTALSDDEKRVKTYTLVEKRINFPGMTRRILAVNWKKATDEQRQRFQELFRHILLDTYWKRIKNYSNEEVEYITGMIEGNTFATIDTVIISDRVEIPITYRMEQVGGKWMAYDFLIESLSLTTNYRAEYRTLIKRHGIDGLLREMTKEVEKLAR